LLTVNKLPRRTAQQVTARRPGITTGFSTGSVLGTLYKSVFTVYRVAGALEKYVQTLEKQRKFDFLKNLYASVNGRTVDDAQMVEFFKMKFWM